MVRHNMNHETLLSQLDALCAQCRALATSQHEKMGGAIRKACDSCKSVRSSLPQLVELAQSMRQFNTALAAARAR